MESQEKKLFRGLFQELETRFIETVRELRSESAIAPIAVLVPTGLLRLHLRRSLAGNGVSHANIRFMTFYDLAERLAGTERGFSGATTSPPALAMELLLATVLEEMKNDLPHFSPVVGKEGFAKALLATFRDLADGLIEPEHLESALRRVRKEKTGGLPAEKLSEVTAVWRNLEKRRKSLGFQSDAERLKAAAQGAESSRWLSLLHAFLVYGFYDFTFAQKKLLQACLEKTRAMVWFPHRDGPAFRYAEPSLRWFRDLGFSVIEASGGKEAAAGVLGKLRERIFLPLEGVEPSLAPPPTGDFLILSAPGEENEAKEVVREVMHATGGGSAAGGGTTGILLPARDPYTNLIAEALSACGVDGSLHPGPALSRTLAGRSLLALARLMESKFRRADVMDFLLTARMKPQSWRSDKCEALPAAQWNYLTMIAGIVGGKEDWERRLADPEKLVRSIARLSGELPVEDRETDDDEDESQRYASRIASVRALRRLVLDLFQKVEQTARRKRWSEMAQRLSSLYTDLLETDDEARAVLSVLDELAGLDALAIEPTPEMFYRFLKESLDKGRERPTGSFQRKEPAVADLMEARGISFDTVILPGLVEKRFPHPVKQDPVLLDWERRKLNALFRELRIDGELPLKKRRKEEEELLFALALGAARSRLVLTFPRLDIGKGRPLVPSFFLLKALEIVEGKPFDYESFERYLRGGPHGRTVPLSSFQPGLRLRAIDRPEHDLAALAAAEQAGRPEALLYLLKESPFFARSLAAETARWSGASFTEFDGLLRAPALLERIGKSFPPAEMKISATQLEEYAACPFHYFIRRILKIEPLEEPEQAVSISPLDLGSMVHSILWEYFTAMDKARRIPLTEDCRERLLEIARRHFLDFERAGVTGYPLLWQIEKERVTEDLNRFFDSELEREREFLPRYFEVRFGSPARDDEESGISTEKAVLFSAGGDVCIRLRGRIDRIDCDSDRRLLRVIDYKTGKPKKGLKDNALLGGKALQLPLYLWAAEKIMAGMQGDSAEYYYASERGGWKRHVFTRDALEARMAELKQIVSTIVKGIAAGRFYAVNASDQCGYCDFRYACGHGKYLDFKWAGDVEAAGAFGRLAEIE